MLLAFVPMLFIASAYYYLNRADPDCGTTFSWVTRAMGPHLGWMGGWGIIAADVIVMANLAQIAGQYTLLPVRRRQPGEQQVVVARPRRDLDRGHDLDLLRRHRGVGQDAVVPARRRGRHPGHLRRRRAAQGVLLEPVTAPSTRRSRGSTRSTSRACSALADGIDRRGVHLLGLGQHRDGERGDRGRHPDARARPPSGPRSSWCCSTSSTRSPRRPTTARTSSRTTPTTSSRRSGGDVLGSPWDKLLIIAVLTSASASTQTTILPTARTSLSMAAHGAIPRRFANIHPRYLTPSTSTIYMGVLSIDLVRRPDRSSASRSCSRPSPAWG